MTKSRRKELPLGVISEGTHKEDELVAALLDVLDGLTLTRSDRRELKQIRERHDYRSGLAVMSASTEWEQSNDLATLYDTGERYCPDFAYLGMHEGDGACLGVWPDPEVLSAVNRHPEIEAGSELPLPRECSKDYFLTINYHGNCTLYKKVGLRAHRWKEVWSIV